MAGIPKIKGAKKIAKTEVVPFTRQLASMIGAGMPILSTIQTLEEQCSNPEFKKVLTHLKDTIEEKILELQNAKSDLAEAILEGEASSIMSMSNEELLALLS